MRVSQHIKVWLGTWLGTWLYNALSSTLRVSVEADERLEQLRQRHGAVIFAGWHSQLLVPLWHHRFTGGYAIVSEHADGEIIARMLEGIGYTCVRGSSTRGGIKALLRLVKVAREGHDIGVTPDGPQGPRYVAQPGVVYLAQKSGCPIVAMGFATSRFWQFRSWDKFKLPKPWSRAAICYGEPIHVPARLSDGEVELWRQRVEASLMAVTRRCEAAVGLPPEDDAAERD